MRLLSLLLALAGAAIVAADGTVGAASQRALEKALRATQLELAALRADVDGLQSLSRERGGARSERRRMESGSGDGGDESEEVTLWLETDAGAIRIGADEASAATLSKGDGSNQLLVGGDLEVQAGVYAQLVETVQLAVGSVDVDAGDAISVPATHSFVNIASDGATKDNVVTLDSGTHGQMLFVYNGDEQKTSGDVVISSENTFVLLYDEGVGEWLDVSADNSVMTDVESLTGSADVTVDAGDNVRLAVDGTTILRVHDEGAEAAGDLVVTGSIETSAVVSTESLELGSSDGGSIDVLSDGDLSLTSGLSGSVSLSGGQVSITAGAAAGSGSGSSGSGGSASSGSGGDCVDSGSGSGTDCSAGKVVISTANGDSNAILLDAATTIADTLTLTNGIVRSAEVLTLESGDGSMVEIKAGETGWVDIQAGAGTGSGDGGGNLVLRSGSRYPSGDDDDGGGDDGYGDDGGGDDGYGGDDGDDRGADDDYFSDYDIIHDEPATIELIGGSNDDDGGSIRLESANKVVVDSRLEVLQKLVVSDGIVAEDGQDLRLKAPEQQKIKIVAGSGSGSGDGGKIVLLSGRAQQSSFASGDINLLAGHHENGGAAGNIVLSSGDSSGAPGKIELTSTNLEPDAISLQGDVTLHNTLSVAASHNESIVCEGDLAMRAAESLVLQAALGSVVLEALEAENQTVALKTGSATRLEAHDLGVTVLGTLTATEISSDEGLALNAGEGTNVQLAVLGTAGGNVSIAAGASGGRISLAAGRDSEAGGDAGKIVLSSDSEDEDAIYLGGMTTISDVLTLASGELVSTSSLALEASQGSSGSPVTITAGAGTGGSGGGGSVTLSGGDTQSGLAGHVELQAGSAAGSGDGGSVTLTAGSGAGSGDHGKIVVGTSNGDDDAIFLDAATTISGLLTLLSGGLATDETLTLQTAKAVLITAGASTGSSASGGAVTLQAGAGYEMMPGGDVILSAGSGAASASAEDDDYGGGGDDYGGSGSLAYDYGGSISLLAGAGSSTGAGAILLSSSRASTEAIVLDGSTTFKGGDVSLSTGTSLVGVGDLTLSAGSQSAVLIQAGSASGGSAIGGALTLSAGDSTDQAGDLNLSAGSGSGSSASGGSVVIVAGSGGGGSGQIRLSTGNSAVDAILLDAATTVSGTLTLSTGLIETGSTLDILSTASAVSVRSEGTGGDVHLAAGSGSATVVGGHISLSAGLAGGSGSGSAGRVTLFSDSTSSDAIKLNGRTEVEVGGDTRLRVGEDEITALLPVVMPHGTGTVVSGSVTINAMTGVITSETTAMSSGDDETITLHNTAVSAESVVITSMAQACAFGGVVVVEAVVTDGQVDITVSNGGSSCSTAYKVAFAVF